MVEKSVAELDFATLTKGRTYFSSPEAWENEVLYFLLVDRFSDGNEKEYKGNTGRMVHSGKTPLFDPQHDAGSAVATQKDAAAWRDAGDNWVGGNLKGLTGKLGYLKRLGVTAVWVSPVFKQAPWAEHTYHGYGIQNFLDIDPHFGTREDLRALVETAHKMDIRVVLDVIVNHTGDVFEYGDSEKALNDTPWNGSEYKGHAFRDKTGKGSLPFQTVNLEKHPNAWPDGAVWPSELQKPSAFSRKGYIGDWENFPEFEEGDFFAFKDLYLGDWKGDTFEASPALKALCAVYKFWIAFADLDGFRLDTVKHMGHGATAYFAREIHHWAASLGKDNFYLIGEITGGRGNAIQTLKETCLDAALGIDEMPGTMRDLVAGRVSPAVYFDMFHDERAHQIFGEEGQDTTWCRNKVVTFFDDHDQVGRKVKKRFAAEFLDNREWAENAVIAALGLTLTTFGIPCIYYGSEQAFDGHAVESSDNRYTREAMLGGSFGSFRSKNRHFFNEDARVFRETAKILALRKEHAALRQGEQYLRPVSENGEGFNIPQAEDSKPYRGIVAWSRLFAGNEIVVALNTDLENACSYYVTLDPVCHKPGEKPLRCLYSTDPAQIDSTTSGPPEDKNGSAVCLTVPPGGFVIFA